MMLDVLKKQESMVNLLSSACEKEITAANLIKL
jgi:hypothetical protein